MTCLYKDNVNVPSYCFFFDELVFWILLQCWWKTKDFLVIFFFTLSKAGYRSYIRMGLIGSLSKVTIPWFSTAELKISKICLSLLGLALYPTLLYNNVKLFQGNFSKSFKETVTIRILTPFNNQGFSLFLDNLLEDKLLHKGAWVSNPPTSGSRAIKKGQIFRTRYLLLDT